MAGVEDYLSQFVGPSGGEVVNAPITPVAQPDPAAQAQITNATADPTQSLLTNIAMDRGNSLATNNPIINDFQTLSAWDFQNKYGVDTFNDMGRISNAGQNVVQLQNTDRSGTEHLTDATSGAVKGLVGGLADAGTLIAGAVNREAGRFAADKTKDFRDWMDEATQTDANARNRYLGGLRAELDSMDNTKQYEREKETKSPFMASLSYLGRGFVNGAYRFYEDPQSLETGLSEGVGSLLAGGPLVKGLGIAGKLAGVGKIASEALMPAAIGLMEGGSAYSGAMQEVMGMSNEELLKNSPSYRQLVAGGMDPDKAKEQIASKAAEVAATIQTPLAVVSGKLVSAFEANPVGSKSFREMVGNIVRETTEEGAQSATGQMAQNLGIQQTADQNKSILEDVGDQTAQGAILGGLTAGVVQIPAIPKVALSTAIDALKARAAEVNTTNENASGVTQEQVLSGIQTANENIEPVAEAVSKLNETLPPEVQRETSSKPFGDRLKDVFSFNPEEVNNLGDNIKKHMTDNGLANVRNNLEFTTNVASVAYDEGMSKEDRTKAGLFVLNQIEKVNKLFSEDLDEAKTNLDQNGEDYQAISQFQNQMENLKNLPSIKQAMDWARENAKVEVSEDTPATPDTIQTATLATTAQPSSLGSKGARTILKQADAGQITVTPEQRKALRNTEIALDIAEKADVEIAKSRQQEDPLTDVVKDVRDQVMTRGMDNGWALSADQHLSRFNTAMMQNDTQAADVALRGLGNFARSQMRKANAWLKSARDGGEQFYTPVGPYGRNIDKRPVTFHANSERSKATARQITIEANALIDQFNALADANPEIGIVRRLDPVERAPEFFGKAGLDQAPQQTQDQPEAAQQAEPREETSAVEVQFREFLEDGLKGVDEGVVSFTDNKGDVLDWLAQSDIDYTLTGNTVYIDEDIARDYLNNPAEQTAQNDAKAAQQSEPREETADVAVEQETPPLEPDDVTEEMLNAPLDADGLWTGGDLEDDLVAVSAPVVQQKETPATATGKMFPFLVAAKGMVNRFVQTFNGEKTGTFLEYGEPIKELRDALDGEKRFDAEQIEALQGYLDQGMFLINATVGVTDIDRGLFSGLNARLRRVFCY